jgi:hypothetical protein
MKLIMQENRVNDYDAFGEAWNFSCYRFPCYDILPRDNLISNTRWQNKHFGWMEAN